MKDSMTRIQRGILRPLERGLKIKIHITFGYIKKYLGNLTTQHTNLIQQNFYTFFFANNSSDMAGRLVCGTINCMLVS